MATLQASEILDLTTSTLRELGRLKFTSIAERLQEYPVMKDFIKKDKMQFDDGYGIQRTIMIDHSNGASHVGMYNTDTVNVSDVLKTITVPWRHTTTAYAWDRRELLMNRGASRIVELIKIKRYDAMLALAELMETAFWNKPADSTDELKPFGLPYWLAYNATTGFNGGDVTGFSAGPGGLSSNTYTRWKNFTAQYTNVTQADLMNKMRQAHRQCKFISPLEHADYTKGQTGRYRIFMNEETLRASEDLATAQNDNLGKDIASMDGRTVFRGHPLIYVPKLDDDSTDDPVYMVDMATLYPVCLKGDYLRESEPREAADKHNVFEVHVDLTWNILCVDRRRNALIAKSDS